MMKKTTFTSIKTKITLSYVCLVLLIAATLGYSSYNIMTNQLRSTQQQNLEFAVKQSHLIVQNLLSEKEARLLEISKSPEVNTYVENYAEPILRHYFSQFKDDFTAISFVNKAGTEEVKLINGKISTDYNNVKDISIFQDITWQPNKVFASQMEMPNDARPVMSFGILRQDFFDDFLGIILGFVYLEDLFDPIHKINIGKTGLSMLVDQSGNILSHPDHGMIMQKISGWDRISEELVFGPADPITGFGRFNMLDRDSFVAYSRIEDRGWLVMTILPYEEFIEAPNKLKLISIVITLLVLMLGMIMSYITSSSLINPILELVKLTGLMAQGDLSKKTAFKSNNEIGTLAASFNKMTDKLKESFELLEKEIADRMQMESVLEHHAYYDHLTGLPNRTMFTKKLKMINVGKDKHENHLFAVLFMDLDRFKIINDSQGHATGDKLLTLVARRLKTCIRPGDTVSRFGGDEFAVLVNSIEGIDDAVHVAKRILEKLRTPFNLNDHEVFITSSIGIAMNTREYEEEEDILRDADAAMYRAKSHGRARYEIFDAKMHIAAINLLQMESDMRHAIEHGEFLAHYQPIVSLLNNEIIGAEALIRWQHPTMGLIPPNEFIPLAEETGMILQIGEWILREACAQNMAWQNGGRQPIIMKVNFSSRQFCYQNIPRLIREVLKETGMSPQHLDVEITESIAMEDNSIAILNALSNMNVQTSIDDFGTGYSSLGSLKRFPINIIKIDRSFIRDISTDPDDEEIVKAIIAMAHNLKIKVIAEGVETIEQQSFLKSNNCDAVQGYLYSRPVPAADFTKLLDKAKVISISKKFA